MKRIKVTQIEFARMVSACKSCDCRDCVLSAFGCGNKNTSVLDEFASICRLVEIVSESEVNKPAATPAARGK